jgi:small subunit ribosomal protein S21
LTDIIAKGEESLDSLLRRFNKEVQQNGIMSEIRRREYFEKSSARRKRKRANRKRGAVKGTKR